MSFSLLPLPVPHLIVSVSVFIVLVVHKVLVSLFRQPLSSPVFLHLHSVLFHLPPLLPVFPALFWFSLYLVVAFLYFFIFLNFLLPAPLVLPWYASGFCSSCLVIDLCLSFHCYFFVLVTCFCFASCFSYPASYVCLYLGPHLISPINVTGYNPKTKSMYKPKNICYKKRPVERSNYIVIPTATLLAYKQTV